MPVEFHTADKTNVLFDRFRFEYQDVVTAREPRLLDSPFDLVVPINTTITTAKGWQRIYWIIPIPVIVFGRRMAAMIFYLR